MEYSEAEPDRGEPYMGPPRHLIEVDEVSGE
jgi:hypothetical protein